MWLEERLRGQARPPRSVAGNVIRGSLAAAALTTTVLVAPVAHADAGDDAFLAAMHAKYPYPAEMDRNVIDAGRAVCTLLDQGITRAQIVRSMADLNVDPAVTGYLVDVAVSSYCPQNVAKLSYS